MIRVCFWVAVVGAVVVGVFWGASILERRNRAACEARGGKLVELYRDSICVDPRVLR